MKKVLFMLLVVVFVVCGCGEGTSSSKNDVMEMSYSNFKEVDDLFWDLWIEETNKLSDVELYGTSDDEDEQYWNMIEKWNDCATDILKDFDIQQGQKIRISGYIEKAVELPSDSPLGKYWPDRKILFQIKHNADDDAWDGIRCQTDDSSFLDLGENAAVTIEGVFIKEGCICEGSETLYDCQIVSE